MVLERSEFQKSLIILILSGPNSILKNTENFCPYLRYKDPTSPLACLNALLRTTVPVQPHTQIPLNFSPPTPPQDAVYLVQSLPTWGRSRWNLVTRCFFRSCCHIITLRAAGGPPSGITSTKS